MKYISVKNIAKFEVRVGDINYGGHMGNDKSLLIFHDARIRFLESLGYSEMFIGDNTGIIMSEAHVYFKKEVLLHDILSVDVSVSELSASSFTLSYHVFRQQDGAEVIHGSTKIIAYDYERKRVTRIPEVFLEKIMI